MNFLKKLFSSFVTKSAALVNSLINVVQKTAPYIEMALPIVEEIANLTANTKDDNALVKVKEAYASFGLEDVFDPNKDRSVALRDLAKSVLIRKLGGEVTKDFLLNAAIEMAYAKFKLELEKQ